MYANRRPQDPAGDSVAESFSAAIASAQADGKQTDFTSMTRQEMRDWANGQIRSGEMSLDDSRPFMAMTMKVPVSGGFGGELAAASDGERLDFTQKAQAGIEAARLRHDDVTLKMLESAMQIMQRKQD
ncbi:hypothetical protein [Pseudaminobacter soli (ex Li et al. 2025)]|uniref:hypothetical protein n=1 Tax=Pseudaminobacter soli (ex Li et al. 2025) TaxID=1295366 RepID=UPI001AECA367|nr:hypothetical protein [Mesorhizobium soli]